MSRKFSKLIADFESSLVGRMLSDNPRTEKNYKAARKALRTALSEAEQRARREALEEAASICDQQSAYFRKLAMDEKCLNDLRWDHREEAQFTMEAYAERHETDAAAIRALIPSEPHDAEGRE